MYIPNKVTEREQAIKFLQATQQHLKDYDKAAAVLARGGQYEDFARDVNKTVQGIFNRGVAEVASKLANYSGYYQSGKITKAQFETERKRILDSVGGEKKLKEDLQKNRDILKDYGEFLTDQEKNSFDQVLDQVKILAPAVDLSTYRFTPQDPKGQTLYAEGRGPAVPLASGKTDVGQTLYAEGRGPGGTSGNSGGTAGVGAATTSPSVIAQTPQEAIDYINSQDLSTATKQMYTDILKNWDPNTELNPQNIIKAFENVKKTSIDPHFQGLANLAIESVQTAAKGMQEQRALELEAERANAAQNISDTQAGLEASGLTFSGEGVKQLGSQAAAPIPFGGQNVEGLVPQRNRLISTSSEAAYKQNLKNLGLGAEEQLGTSKAKSLLSGYGYKPVGGVAGSFEEAKQSAYGSALGNIINQQTANAQQGYNLDV